MADPFRKGVAANLGWQLSLWVAAAAFLSMAVGLGSHVAFMLVGLALIAAGVLHALAGAKVPAGVRGSPEPVGFRIWLTTTGALCTTAGLTSLAALSPLVTFAALGAVLLGIGILFPVACAKLSAFARFSHVSREVRASLILTGVQCIAIWLIMRAP